MARTIKSTAGKAAVTLRKAKASVNTPLIPPPTTRRANSRFAPQSPDTPLPATLVPDIETDYGIDRDSLVRELRNLFKRVDE